MRVPFHDFPVRLGNVITASAKGYSPLALL